MEEECEKEYDYQPQTFASHPGSYDQHYPWCTYTDPTMIQVHVVLMANLQQMMDTFHSFSWLMKISGLQNWFLLIRLYYSRRQSGYKKGYASEREHQDYGRISAKKMRTFHPHSQNNQKKPSNSPTAHPHLP